MQENELILRRELEIQSSDQLRAILHAETEKEVPDDDLVIAILHILEDREPDELASASAKEEVAYKLFRKRVQARKKPLRLGWKSLNNVAVLLIVVGLLFTVIPQQAEADSLWDVLARWVNGTIEFFDPEEIALEAPFAFETENEGPQQIYDAAVEMGIEQPLIPMWFPEEYAFKELVSISTPRSQSISVLLVSDSEELVFQIRISEEDNLHGYFGDEEYYDRFEREGAKYKTIRNNDRWSAVWIIDKTEYLLTLDCQEDTLQRILDSIYVMEE